MEPRITEMQAEEQQFQEEETILESINEYYGRMDG